MRRWQIILLFLLGASALIISLLPETRQYVMSVFEKIKSLIAGEEGLRLSVYQDAAGKWTIGYGHLIKPGEPYYPYGPIKEITQQEAESLFLKDIAQAEQCVKTYVTVPLTENQYAALVSFVFNVGCSAFRNSLLLKYLNAGDYSRAAEELNKWVYATKDGVKIKLAGLVSRRLRERQLFLA